MIIYKIGYSYIPHLVGIMFIKIVNKCYLFFKIYRFKLILLCYFLFSIHQLKTLLVTNYYLKSMILIAV